MARKGRLNERRLTRRQVQALISSGARPRPDLSAQLEQTFATGYKERPLVYELEGNRYLYVFDELWGQGGKGDIYAADDFLRFVRWTVRVRDDQKHWRGDSVSHWGYYSTLKHRLISNIDVLIEQLRSTMSRSQDHLDLSYESLDIISEFVEGIGVERAQKELYDHLVAYIGEVLRLRIQGRWEVNRGDDPPYPYLVGAQHSATMPINVVWGELRGLHPVNLRAAAANEVRRTRLPSVPVDVSQSARAAAPIGTLGSLPSAVYEVRRRYADGRPAAVLFMGSVEVAGLSCRGEAWFKRKGELVAATLSREQPVGGRRFGAGCFVRYYRSQEDGRVADVKLAEDQEVDGLPCRAGKLVTFDRKQRLSFLELTTDCEIEGVPCAGGHHVEFQDGRLSAAILATDHVLIDRRFPRGTYAGFVKEHLRSVLLQEDWDIDGIPVQAGSTVEFYENGRPRTMVLARSRLILGRRYEKGTLLQRLHGAPGLPVISYQPVPRPYSRLLPRREIRNSKVRRADSIS
jgi:hypothetical protein